MATALGLLRMFENWLWAVALRESAARATGLRSSETNTTFRPMKLEKLHTRISAPFVILNLLWSRGCPWWSIEGHFSKTAKRVAFTGKVNPWHKSIAVLSHGGI